MRKYPSWLTHCVAAGIVACVTAGTAVAQAYPAKPIRVIVPVPGGSGMDTVGRIALQKMGQNMGANFVIENMNRFTGPQAVARAAPDGYTLMVNTESLPLIALLGQAQGFDPMKDFQMFGTIARAVFILSVNPSVPVQSVEEFVLLAKSKPGALAYGTSGIGSPHHLVTEMFAEANGLQLLHVPFKGSSETVTALTAGTIQFAMGLPSSFAPLVKAGKFRALAVTSAKRTTAFPDIPTLAERAVTPVEYESWWGLFAPSATPRPVVERLHAELGRVLADRAYIEGMLAKQGLEPFEQPSAAAAAALVRTYYDKLAPVVKKAGIKAG
jgi:tripartite-type tricarboxylate transporter receptor subunit TctC